MTSTARAEAVVTIDASERGYLITAALVFVASAAVTVLWCGSMAAMGGMPMPGDWTMSMAWMRMGDQTWLDLAAMFVGMWVVMMVAMMLPSLVPMLHRYRRSVGPVDARRLDGLTAIVAAGYFCVWTALGVAAFPVGAALAELAMQSPGLAHAVPLATGLVVLIAGALQFTAWKEARLGCCRHGSPGDRSLPVGPGTAWRRGLRLGLDCTHCCAGLMAVLFVTGVMDLGAMALVMAAITAERLLPDGKHVARVVGGAVVAGGLILTGQAIT